MRYSKYLSTISTLIDLMLMNIFFNLGFWILKGFDPKCFESIGILFLLYINLAWLISANIFKAYSTDKQMINKDIVVTYITVHVFFFFLFLIFFQLFDFIFYYTKETKQILLPSFFISIVSIRFLFNYFLLLYRKSGYNYRNVVILGYNETAINLRNYFDKNTWTGCHFKKFFVAKRIEDVSIAQNISELEDYILSNSINEIFVTLNELTDNTHEVLSSITSKYPVKIKFVPDLSKISYMSLELINYDTVNVLQIKRGPLYSLSNRLLKRSFDIIISIITIVLVLSWIIPILWILNIICSNDGLFFIQKRSGLNNLPFNMIKFCTMKINKEADLVAASENDKRVTKIGKFLRKTSIDEFPQFFNVLHGKMSVVGPRPHMLKHTDEYKEIVNKFMIRHSIKPGITGYAQVNGLRGSINEVTDIEERIKLDIKYIQDWSLWLDIKIIFLTIWNVFRGDKKAY